MTDAEIVRRIYDSWNADDWDAGARFFHPEIEWRTSGQFPGFDPVYHGPAGVRRFWDAMKEAWEYFTIDIARLFDEGEGIVTDVRFNARGKESGATVTLAFAHAWFLEDGLVRRYSSHHDLKDALRAAEIPVGQLES